MSVLYLAETLLSYCGLRPSLISFTSGMSILPLAGLYFVSHLFGFCFYHRVFIHYITFNLLVNIIDYYIGIPLTNRSLFVLLYTAFCLTLFLALYDYNRNRRCGSEDDSE